jgi:hypothetical protein
MIEDEVGLGLCERLHHGVDLRIAQVRLEGHRHHHLHPEFLGQQVDVLQVFAAGVRIRMKEADGRQADVLAPGHQGAKFLAVFGAHRKHHRLVRPPKARRAGHRAEEGHASVVRHLDDFHRRTALDRTEEQEGAVTDQRTGIGLSVAGLVVVVQGAQHQLAAMHAAGGIDLVDVELRALLGRHAVVVLAALQGDVLADEDGLVGDASLGGRGQDRRAEQPHAKEGALHGARRKIHPGLQHHSHVAVREGNNQSVALPAPAGG